MTIRMKSIKRLLGVVLLGIISHSGIAQTKNQIKAEQALEEKQYIKALNFAEKACEDEASSKDPYSYSLKSQALYHISRDEKLRDKHPSSLKNAVKTATKAFKKAEKEGTLESFKEDNEEFLSKLKDANNENAALNSRLGKYSKATALYKTSYDMAKDTFSYFMIGHMYEKQDDGSAIDYYKEVAKWNVAAFEKGNLKNTYRAEPFIYLSDYYVRMDSIDKARFYTMSGIEMFPDRYELQKQKYEFTKSDLLSLPPSGEYLSIVQRELINFPYDSFLLHKENAISLYLINAEINSPNNGSSDSLINIFAEKKQSYFNHKYERRIKEIDPFVKEKKQEVRMLLVDYYSNSGNAKASNFVFDYWMRRTYQSKESEAAYLREIAGFEKDMRISLITQLYDHVAKRYSSEGAKKQKNDYFYSMDISTVPYNQLGQYIALNESVAEETPSTLTDNRLRINKLKYIEKTADANDFFLSYFAFDDFVINYGESTTTDSMLKDVSMKDFDFNYFGSAIKVKRIGNSSLPDIKWQDGSVSSCRIGYLPDSIHQKVLDRMNYFRRNAGIVKPTVLVKQLNEMCQQAVVMFEANKKLNHNPPNTWRCYNNGSALAAKNSLITQKTNSVLAVSSFMKDNKEHVGNRRWLLNPYAKGMGHGSTYEYCAIWAMDLKDMRDSTYYIDNFVAWPGIRCTPKMLAFDYWSFSLHEDMEGATVSMQDAIGVDVPVKQFSYAKGYGLPTLVWKPTINLATKGDQVYIVTVTLANEKSFTYTVTLIDYKPVMNR
jgi:hypothetical protein